MLHDDRAGLFDDEKDEMTALLPADGLNIVRGHALELVADLGPYDLLVTDPPYAFGGDGAEHAMSATVATVLRESGQRLRKGGWAIVFAATSWRSTYYMIEAVRGVLEPVRFGTWLKPVAKSKVRTPGWAWASVQVIVMRRPGSKNPNGGPSPLLDYIIEPPVMNGRRAELPPSVASWAVAPFALPGGLAFDPFAGSGALLRAASEAGMDTLGFEIEHSEAGYVPPGDEVYLDPLDHPAAEYVRDEIDWLRKENEILAMPYSHCVCRSCRLAHDEAMEAAEASTIAARSA